MIFQVRHITRYRYDRPVFLEPQTIRLRPRGEGAQRLRNFSLALEPAPAGLVEYRDAEGNDVACAWFNGQTEGLTVTAACEVETLRGNPFDFILTDQGVETLPVLYTLDLHERLLPALACSGTPTVAAFASSVAAEAGGRTMDFLRRLSSRLHEMMTVVLRSEGDPLPAERTLAEGHGSCRDLAVLFLAACRTQGLAARFVSGYQEGNPDAVEHHLHAWAEVYLPGGGWRGFDPTLGQAVGEGHVALAASIDPGGAAPLSGRFRGTGAGASLDFELQVLTAAG